MKIIIEDVLANNFIIDFLIIYLTLTFLKLNKRYSHIIFASIIGAIFSVIYPLINLPQIFLFVIKTIFGGVMVYIFSPLKLKKFWLVYVVFWVNTFILGGITIAMSYVMFGTLSSNSFIIGITYISAIIYYILSQKIIKILYARRLINNFSYFAEITIANKTKKVNCYLDSGNTLNCETRPVSIMTLDKLEEFYIGINIVDVLQKKQFKELECSQYIIYKTLSGQSSMLVFKPQKFLLHIDNEIKDCSDSFIGISLKDISQANLYSMILNSSLM